GVRRARFRSPGGAPQSRHPGPRRTRLDLAGVAAAGAPGWPAQRGGALGPAVRWGRWRAGAGAALGLAAPLGPLHPPDIGLGSLPIVRGGALGCPLARVSRACHCETLATSAERNGA